MELCALYVDPEHWGRGMGVAFVSAARHRLIDLGFLSAVLWGLASNVRWPEIEVLLTDKRGPARLGGKMITEPRPLRCKKATAAERLRKSSELAIERLPAETLDILTFHAPAYRDRALDTRRFMDEFHTLRDREGAARSGGLARSRNCSCWLARLPPEGVVSW
jgi:hypothetical protein